MHGCTAYKYYNEVTLTYYTKHTRTQPALVLEHEAVLTPTNTNCACTLDASTLCVRVLQCPSVAFQRGHSSSHDFIHQQQIVGYDGAAFGGGGRGREESERMRRNRREESKRVRWNRRVSMHIHRWLVIV